jgi:AcrR family transcriptional regulator
MVKKTTGRKNSVREQKKRRTRKKILTAAYKLFARKGYEQTSVDMLAREAGIGKGTIYSYFKTKGEILLAFCEEELEFVMTEIAAKMDPEAPLSEQLLTVFMGQFRYISRNRDFGRLLMREMTFPKEMTVERSREMDERFFALLIPIFDRAQERGELQSDLPLMFIIGNFYALYIMTVSAWYMGRLQNEEDVAESLRMLLEQAMYGLTPHQVEQ